MIMGASPPPGWPSERNAESLCGQLSLNMSKTSRAHPSLPQCPHCAPQQCGHLLSEQMAGTACVQPPSTPVTDEPMLSIEID